MKIAICDDEPIYIQSLQEKIDLWAAEKGLASAITVATYSSSEDLLEDFQRTPCFDLMFLDIKIPGELSGMQLAREIHAREESLPIVFITNYAEFVYEGYTVNAVRYLRKPVIQEDVFECMDIIWHQWEVKQHASITIESGYKTVRVAIQSILYIEVLHHNLTIHITDSAEDITIRCTLEKILNSLPNDLFSRCHRSFVVNINYVRSFSNGIIKMAGGAEVPIGRSYFKSFVSCFKKFYQGEYIK